MMISRRSFFGFMATAPAAAVAAPVVQKPDAYVPLPDGRAIPVNLGSHTITVEGDADERTAALIDAKLKAANARIMADLQRNLGQMQARWERRSGP